MEKINYVEPEMEVVLFETEDVIVTSGIELPDHEWQQYKAEQGIT